MEIYKSESFCNKNQQLPKKINKLCSKTWKKTFLSHIKPLHPNSAIILPTTNTSLPLRGNLQLQKKVNFDQSFADKLTLLHSLGFETNNSFQQKNESDLTLLHFAAYFNSPLSTLYLLYRGLNINDIDKDGKSVFHLCAYTGHLDVLVYIHEFWKFNRIKQLNDNFLKILTKIGFKRTDSKAGKLKIQVSKQREQKYAKGQSQIVQLYKQYRAQYTGFILKSYELQDINSGRNAFHHAAQNKYQRCLTTLEYMVKSLHNQDLVLSDRLLMDLNEVSPLVQNFNDPRQLQDSLSIIREFILPQTLKNISHQENQKIRTSMEIILQAKNKDSHTPIFLASKTGSPTIVALLKKLQSKYIDNTASKTAKNDQIIKIALNNETRNQITDLCEASKSADVEIINFLISCGEQINKKKTIFGTFALLQAIKMFQKQKNIEPIQILLKSGADANQQDSNGWTIFHHIAEKGYTQILKQIFVERQEKRISKLQINKVTNKGYHPLHIAAMNDQTEIIEMLLSNEAVKNHGIDVNPLDEEKATILHYAAKKGCLKTMKKILELKGKVLIDCKDVNDNTCLHLAATNNHVDCVKEIIYYDSDNDNLIKIRNKKGKLAKDLTLKKKSFESIFTASREGDVNMIRNLLNQKPDLIDAKTPIKARTPLILSVMEMQLVNVKFLVDSQADQYHEDADQKTASNYAKELEELYLKKDKSKIPLIKKIKALLD